jgi:hypothetical protein
MIIDLYHIMTGGRAGTEANHKLITQLNAIERSYGGVGPEHRKAAALGSGVSLRTWERWRAGTQKPGRRSVERIRLAARRARLAPGRERWMTGKPYVRITAEFWVSNEKRKRTIEPGPYMAKGWMRPVIDAWLKGNDGTADGLIWAALDDYVPGMLPEPGTITEFVIKPKGPDQ